YSTRTFTYDTTAPTITLDYPLSESYSQVKVSTPIQGTTSNTQSAPNTGALNVEISITEDPSGTPLYFNGTNFVGGGPYYQSYSGGDLANWTYDDANLSFTNNKEYQVDVRVYDVASNTSTLETVTFKYDVEIPTSAIVSPVPGYRTSPLTEITGTAGDERYGGRTYRADLGTYTVGVAIYSVSDDRWWNDSSEDYDLADPSYYEVVNDTTTNPDEWTYTLPNPLANSFANGQSYRIVSRAYDLADNAEFGASTAPAGVGYTIIFDTQTPTVTINNPLDTTPGNDNLPRITTVTVLGGLGWATIAGDVDDGSGPGNGIQLVQLRVWKSSHATDPKYWDEGIDYTISAYTIDEGDADTAWFTADSTDSYATSWYSTFTFVTDFKYHIEVRAQDDAGTYSTVYATASFIMDQNVPTSEVVTPVNNATIKTLTQITGTKAETGTRYKGYVDEVLMGIRELGPPSNGKWWDGAGFNLGAAPTSVTATLYTSTWSYTGINGGDLETGTSYYITTRARDNATPNPGNDEGFFTVGHATFTWDIDTATGTFLEPVSMGLFFNTLPIISGTAEDSTSPNSLLVEISIKNESANTWWEDTNGDGGGAEGWGGVGSQYWVQTATQAGDPAPWEYNFPDAQWTHGSSYTIRVRVTDEPQNQSPEFGPVGFTFDTGYSTTNIVSPSAGGYFNTASPKVIGTATETVSAIQSVEIAISSTAAGDAGSWWTGATYTGASEVWVATTSYDFVVDPDSWTFIPSNLENGKTYLVKRRVTDTAGNVRDNEAAQYLYDNGLPQVFIEDPDPVLEYVRSLPIISGTANPIGGVLSKTEVAIQTSPATSGNFWDPATQDFTILSWDEARWKTSNGTPGDWHMDGASTPTWENNAEYKIYVRSEDQAGNVSSVVVSSFTYDNEEPVAQVGRP
ncbi:hypothetical protein BVX98_07865, partial [bacterium F11]